MREIWKYKLDIGYLGVMIPKDAVILDIQWQVDSAVLWCIVNTNNQLEQRTFIGITTGECKYDFQNLEYISTIQVGGFVNHYFEEK